mmetsp:Transcript_44531/g.66101  ORF Transcript_44531/g.66101 Transcript_44531/m.66101 type:complete len:198 (-) Transcript_44531:81-674(-)|eukprot:CAMPEP_0194047068 /NCGR_PEP_ID=MMETSP0009_2-20130614/23540_1 /TAXON_ID=210454 /ORGANISM="Grammatophora oceanica, Strain CCMP 410" /LENGTH=197 /DNA_ID=CAMNT_0038692583 /DNA_START=83 /DNA_END=676 /DNA_ORIENTATION=-
MFLPGNNQKEKEAEKRRHYDRVEALVNEQIPNDIRADAQITVTEVQCGDPQCAPIDTSIVVMFSSGGRGMLGLPMESKDVNLEELKEVFPPDDILRAWHRGEDPDWPGLDDETMPQLRFEIGTLVECRIGPTDWAPGKVAQLWYREPGWPQGSWAPYKIRLDDGRDIFAPGDLDQIIRRRVDPSNNPAADTTETNVD